MLMIKYGVNVGMNISPNNYSVRKSQVTLWTCVGVLHLGLCIQLHTHTLLHTPAPPHPPHTNPDTPYPKASAKTSQVTWT